MTYPQSLLESLL